MGGLGILSRLFTDVVVLLSVAIGLWIGSIPYAFKHMVIMLMLFSGLVFAFFMLVYLFYQLHLIMEIVRSERMRESLSILREVQATYDRSLSLETRIDLLMRLLSAELVLMQAYRMRSWPVNYRIFLESLSTLMSFLPTFLQYICSLIGR